MSVSTAVKNFSCAAASNEAGAVRHWTTPGPHGGFSLHLDSITARHMLVWLREQQLAGARLFAWNGLSFDLRWLGVAAEDIPLAAEVALDLFDPMFQFFVQRGFPVGLGKVADGLGVKEAKLMDGADAPVEWGRGNHQRVLDYVAGDCRITEEVVARIESIGVVRWRTQRGAISVEPMPRLRRVRELLHVREPDTSWMSEPMSWLPVK